MEPLSEEKKKQYQSGFIMSFIDQKNGLNIKRAAEMGFDMNAPDTIGRLPLVEASKGDFDTFETLINCGADINLADSDGRTPFANSIILATKYRHLKLLLEKGVKQTSILGERSALLFLVEVRGDPKYFKLLLKHRAVFKDKDEIRRASDFLVSQIDESDRDGHSGDADAYREILKILYDSFPDDFDSAMVRCKLAGIA